MRKKQRAKLTGDAKLRGPYLWNQIKFQSTWTKFAFIHFLLLLLCRKAVCMSFLWLLWSFISFMSTWRYVTLRYLLQHQQNGFLYANTFTTLHYRIIIKSVCKCVMCVTWLCIFVCNVRRSVSNGDSWWYPEVLFFSHVYIDIVIQVIQFANMRVI